MHLKNLKFIKNRSFLLRNIKNAFKNLKFIKKWIFLFKKYEKRILKETETICNNDCCKSKTKNNIILLHCIIVFIFHFKYYYIFKLMCFKNNIRMNKFLPKLTAHFYIVFQNFIFKFNLHNCVFATID